MCLFWPDSLIALLYPSLPRAWFTLSQVMFVLIVLDIILHVSVANILFILA